MEEEGLWMDERSHDQRTDHYATLVTVTCTCAGNYFIASTPARDIKVAAGRGAIDADAEADAAGVARYSTGYSCGDHACHYHELSEKLNAVQPVSPSIKCSACTVKLLSEKGRGWGPRKTPTCAIAAKPKNRFVCLFVCLTFFVFIFAHLSKQTIAGKAAVAEPRVYNSKRLRTTPCTTIVPCESKDQKQLNCINGFTVTAPVAVTDATPPRYLLPTFCAQYGLCDMLATVQYLSKYSVAAFRLGSQSSRDNF